MECDHFCRYRLHGDYSRWDTPLLCMLIFVITGDTVIILIWGYTTIINITYGCFYRHNYLPITHSWIMMNHYFLGLQTTLKPMFLWRDIIRTTLLPMKHFRCFGLLLTCPHNAGLECWPHVDPWLDRTGHVLCIFDVLEWVLCLQMGWPPVFINDTCFSDSKMCCGMSV